MASALFDRAGRSVLGDLSPRPSGIVPVAFRATDAQYWAPTPEARLLVQLAISLKFSE